MTVTERERQDDDILIAEQEDELLQGAPWRRFAVLGDSVAEGLGDPIDGYDPLPWAPRVARALRRRQPELAELNLGRRHLRAAEVRAGQLGPALFFQPDLASVICGGNDIMAREFEPGELHAELTIIVSALRAAGADVLMHTLFRITSAIEVPPPFGERLAARMAQMDDIVQQVATAEGALLVDVADHPRGGDPGIYSADLTHANMRGHAIVATETIRRLGEELRRSAAPPRQTGSAASVSRSPSSSARGA